MPMGPGTYGSKKGRPMKKIMATTKKKLTTAQKYNQLKRQTENAGMKVKEVDGKIVVTRKKKK